LVSHDRSELSRRAQNDGAQRVKLLFKKIFAAVFFFASFLCTELKCYCWPSPFRVVILEETSLALRRAPSAGEVPSRMTARGGELPISIEAVRAESAQSKDETKAAHGHYEKAMKQKDASERFKLLQEGAARYPFSAELHYALGREFHQRLQMDSALVHFEAVLALDATLARKTDLEKFLPQAYGAIAQQALKLGKLEEAEAAAQNSLRHDADNVIALNVAAVAAYQRKHYEQALDYGARLLKLQPSARNHNNLGAVYEGRGELTLAERHYQQAVVLDPSLAEAQKNLQRVHARTNELIAEATRKELANNNPAKASSTARLKPEQKTKAKVPAKSASSSQPAIASTKNFTAAPRAKLKIGPPRVRERKLQLAPLPRLAAPPIEWNTVRAPKRNEWATTVWVVAFLALSVIVWRSIKSRNARFALEGLKKILARRKAAIKPGVAAVRDAARMNTEGARTLRRIDEDAPLPLSARASGNEALNESAPLLAPERARPLLPPSSPRVAVAPSPIGLQTEVLFAEMIAAAPEAFDGSGHVAAVETPENAGANGKHNGVAILNGHEAARENEEKAHAQVAPANNDEANAPAAAESFLSSSTPQETSPKIVVLQELPARPARPEIQTPHFVVAAPNLASEKTPSATPSLLEAQTETRTMTLPALAAQRIGRYVIEKELAHGTTGKIYKAWDPKLDRVVVLKTVQYGLSCSAAEIAALKERIYREARAIAKLNHPNIVIVYDVDDEPEFSFLVMEYLEGRDLKQVLEQERRLDCGRALEIAVQTCNAMEYAHRAGVFHRDVKPSNIMLLDKDEVKVMDFGIAKIGNYLSLTQTGRVLGTPSYMAPEQIEGHATDGRADLFSLGVVLYELLAGKRPFAADSLAALAYKIVHKTHMPPSLENVELPMALDEVLNRALAKKPEERYQNAAELRAALMEVKAKLAECQTSV
jgi:tetratricopeptide (TPR) repeat protein/tRNA A-37 threonylcarbamoyl transferase component Bud32